MRGHITPQANARLATYSIFTQLAAAAYVVALIIAIVALAWAEYRRQIGYIELGDPKMVPFVIAGLAIIAGLVTFIVAMIAFLLWFHKAIANLHAVGLAGLRARPVWSGASFFVPVAQLFVPFLAMRELWNRSHGEDEYQSRTGVTQVAIWWMSFVTGSLLVFFVTGLGLFNLVSPVKFISPSLLNLSLMLSGLVFWCVAAAGLVVILRAITLAQATLMDEKTVFA